HVSETAFGPTDEVFFHEWVSVGGAPDSNSVGGPGVNLRAPSTPTAPFQRIDLVAFGRSSPSRPMTFIQFGILQFVRHGRIVVAGRLPEHLRSATASVVLRTGRCSCPGQLAPGGGFTIAFHSHKRLLWVAVWAVQPDGDETRVGRRLVVNLHAARSRTMLDEAGDMLALRAFTDIPARPCEAAPPTNPDSLSIHWIIPDFQQGAGGHMNIFRIVRHLQDAGHRNVFWIIGESRHADPADYIDRHFVRLDCPVNHLSADNLDQVRGDVVVATNCWSAYYVRGIRQVARKCYLVQDYEPWFFAEIGRAHV